MPGDDPEPRNMVCEHECRLARERCAGSAWQQCDVDLQECIDSCL